MAEHWLKNSKRSKPGSTYNSSSLFGVICKDIWELQNSVQQFVHLNSSFAVNSQLVDSMCKSQHRGEVFQLVQKVRRRIDEEFHVIFENASGFDVSARSQHITEGIHRLCKEHEEFVMQNLTEKGHGANLPEYIKMYAVFLLSPHFLCSAVFSQPIFSCRFVGMLYQSCYEDMRARSDNAYEQRKKRKDAPESTEDPDFDQRAERDSSAKWTLVQLPFKIFSPILQTYVFFCCHSSRTSSPAHDILLYCCGFSFLPFEIFASSEFAGISKVSTISRSMRVNK
jgi:hypothetical protein